MSLPLFFNTATRKFQTGALDSRPVTSLTLKRGDTCEFAVRFITDGAVVELGSGAAGKIGMKEDGDYNGDFVASDTSWTKTGTGTSTIYTFNVNLATDELNALLTGDTASVDLMMEMEYTISGVIVSSPKITVTVENDVVKGDETGPTLTGGTVPPVNEEIDVTGALTSDGSTPIVINLPLAYNGISNSKPVYYDPGDGNAIEWSGTYWAFITSAPAAEWRSSENVATPDLVTTWTPQGSATGTPVVTLTNATEGYLGTMKVDENYLYIACSVTDGIPLWKKVSLSAL